MMTYVLVWFVIGLITFIIANRFEPIHLFSQLICGIVVCLLVWPLVAVIVISDHDLDIAAFLQRDLFPKKEEE